MARAAILGGRGIRGETGNVRVGGCWQGLTLRGALGDVKHVHCARD